MANEYYTNIDINDEDYVVNKMFNSDGTKKNNREDRIYQKSSNVPPVKNKRKNRQKPKGMKQIATKAIIFVALGAGLVVGANEMKNSIQDYGNYLDVSTELHQSVVENTNTYGYNANEQRPYWDYDAYGIANSILNENQEYDIDTRIYGAYDSLNEYKKEESMDKIFAKMSSIVGSNSEKFSDDVLHACLFDTWHEYVESKFAEKDMTYEECLKEYLSTMQKVVRAYAKEDSLEEKSQALLEDRQELLDDINLGGGSR